MIKREQFLKQIRPFYQANDLIKVILGVRRAGKSVLLSQIADEIRASGIDDDHIIEINFELLDFRHIKTAIDLNSFIKSKTNNDELFYLFLDEVQNVKDFELAINSLRAQSNINIFITGSNSHLLAGDLATYLSGRYVKFIITPFTFSEVAKFSGDKKDVDIYRDFLEWGGLPGRFAFDADEPKFRYIQDVYASIVLRDIMERNGLRDTKLLDDLVQFLLDNIGNLFSANAISKFLKSQSKIAAADTLINYIGYITSSFMFNKVNRYDIRGKNVFATLEKYYVADTGLLKIKSTSTDVNLGSAFENLVANELIARGYKLNIGVLPNSEIDFIAEKHGIRQYIQVAWKIESDETLQREIGAFNGITDNFERILITENEQDLSQSGIKHINIINWLMEGGM